IHRSPLYWRAPLSHTYGKNAAAISLKCGANKFLSYFRSNAANHLSHRLGGRPLSASQPSFSTSLLFANRCLALLRAEAGPGIAPLEGPVATGAADGGMGGLLRLAIHEIALHLVEQRLGPVGR